VWSRRWRCGPRRRQAFAPACSGKRSRSRELRSLVSMARPEVLLHPETALPFPRMTRRRSRLEPLSRWMKGEARGSLALPARPFRGARSARTSRPRASAMLCGAVAENASSCTASEQSERAVARTDRRALCARREYALFLVQIFARANAPKARERGAKRWRSSVAAGPQRARRPATQPPRRRCRSRDPPS
jgi:hypothetical protein